MTAGGVFAIFFLTPWAAIATLVGAASIPVIIHLLNRRRFRVVQWAAMRFLLAAQKRTTRKLRIEQWLLLAIRTLIIILLILAMISVMPWLEPLWNKLFPGGVTPVAAKTGRTHRIIAIDGGYSMGRRFPDGTGFERACNTARQIIQNSNPGDGFSLILLGAPIQAIVPGPSDNTGNVIREIESLRMPHANSDLPNGLAAIEKIVAQPLGKYHQREVYVLTDLQRTFFQGALPKGPITRMEGLESKLPEADPWHQIQKKASVVLVDVAREGADNLAVTNLLLNEPIVLVNQQNSIRAVIKNFGSQKRTQLKVELLVGKARPESEEGKQDGEPFSLDGRAAAGAELVDVEPGAEVAVTFPLSFTRAGEYVAQVRIEGDALDLDNSRSLVVAVKESIPVLLVNGKSEAERDDQATHHLAAALNPMPENTRNPVSPFRPRVITEAQFADRVSGGLDQYDCVFICDAARLSENKVNQLEGFLRRGGGVIFCLGSKVDREAYNRLLYKEGEGILPAQIIRPEEAPEGQSFTLTADDESFAQPPLASFQDPNDRGTLLSARFRRYLRVQPAPKSAFKKVLSFLPPAKSGDRPQPGSAGRSLLDPAVIEWQRHRGRVILITTTVNIDWGTWPGSPA